MKKGLLILMLSIWASQLMAQNNVDTIHPADWRHYHFDYKWWDDPDTANSSWGISFGADHYNKGYDEMLELVQKRYEHDTLRVIGLAGCAELVFLDDCFLAGNSRDDDDEYLRLYKPIGGSMVLLGEGVFNVNNDLVYRLCTDVRHPIPHNDYLPVYEVYFDTTLLVTDSFYVGMTSHNNWRNTENNYLWPTRPVYPILYYQSTFNEGTILLQNRLNRIRFQYTPTMWDYVPGNKGLCVWPILEDDWPIEKRCPTPDNLDMVTFEGGCSITWDGPANQTQWQLSYSPVANQPDSGTIVDLNSNTWYHVFADDTPQYIYIRGYCHDERCWSLWSETLMYGDTTTEEGIRRLSTLESQTNLYPNPATSTVTVTSGYTLERLEVCTLEGQVLQSRQVKGHAATMDLSPIEPGMYLVIIHTAHGRTAKRMVKK